MNNKEMTGLTKQRVTIAPYSTMKIDYNDTKPNYYRVQNTGETPIYCGTSHMPTSNNYDFMCNAQAMKMYAEPFKRTSLYIFNPSGNEIVVTVLSFSAEFDPLTLALSEISLDLPTADLGLSTVVSSFESPLPQGDNTIGAVSLAGCNMSNIDLFFRQFIANADTGAYLTMADVLVKMDALIRTINDKEYNIDNSDVVSAINNKEFSATIEGGVTVDNSDVVEAINNKQFTVDNSDVVTAINNKKFTVDNSDVVSAINNKEFTIDNSDVVSAINNSAKPKQVISKGENLHLTGYGSKDITAGTGNKITCIDFICNDSETDVTLSFNSVEIPIKAGEVINSVRVYADTVMIAEDNGNAVDVRYLVTIEGV